MTDRSVRKEKRIRRADLLILSFFLILSCLLFAVNIFSVKEAGLSVEIRKDGSLIGKFPLSEDADIPVGDGNVCRIRNGEAFMLSADCPDQSCVHSRPISGDGETIVCLPNRVSLSISGEGPEEVEYDTVAE